MSKKKEELCIILMKREEYNIPRKRGRRRQHFHEQEKWKQLEYNGHE
jgi:hypothetical protein